MNTETTLDDLPDERVAEAMRWLKRLSWDPIYLQCPLDPPQVVFDLARARVAAVAIENGPGDLLYVTVESVGWQNKLWRDGLI